MKQNLVLFFLAISIQAEAQTLPQTVSFKTPEVAAFNRFVEMPVSYYTGVPNISIPLYEITMNGVTVPVSLDYHAGGIRVDQEATWVGLGWSLNYGGTISRSVKGGPDEFNFLFGGTNSSYTSINNFMALPGWLTDPYMTQRTQKIRDAKNVGVMVLNDFMPDEFNYSVLGHSGKFMFSQEQKKFISFPKEDILIRDYGSNNTLTESYQNFHPLNCWNIKLADGTSIDFGKDGTISQSLGDVGSSLTAKTAWQIKTIRNNFNDSINFSYSTSNYSAYKFSGEKYSSSSSSSSRTMSQFSFSDVRLSSITFPGGSISLISTDRIDMPAGTKKLTELNVYNNQGLLVKKILFYYSYFSGSSFDALPSINSTLSSSIPADQQFKRLRLDSVAFSGTTLQPITYKFNYHTSSSLPAKISFAQDHWGFFNGMPNTTLLPPVISPSYAPSGDRRVKPDNSNVFTLKSITYPEGGKTEFVYESNTAGNSINTIPNELLSIYQDDNMVNRMATIGFSGHNNNDLFPAPDISNPNQLYTYKNSFTVGAGVLGYSPNGFNCYTNYGVYDMSSYLYGTGKVTFTLERVNADNTKTLVKTFDALNLGTNADPSVTNIQPITLAAGNYEMTVIVYPYYGYPPPSNQNNHSTNFTISWQEAGSTNQINIGGLRVKQINYYNTDNSFAKQKKYQYVKPVSLTDNTLTANSSGQVVSFPNYVQAAVRRTGDPFPYDVESGINISSGSVVPLESTSGSYCGYENVTETETDNTTTLRTDYKFSFVQPYFSEYYASYMYALIEPKEWERGKLLSKKYFKGNQVIRSENYTYHSWSPHLSNNTSEEYVQEINTDLISGQSMVPIGQGTTPFPPDFYYRPSLLADIAAGYLSDNSGQYRFNYAPDDLVQTNIPHQARLPYFKRYTGFDRLQTKTITTYDDNGNSLTQTENYFYEKTPVHYELTRTEANNSKGEIIKTNYKYPLDYANITAVDAVSQGVKKLSDTYTISAPVETSTYKLNTNGTNSRLISSSFTTFKTTLPLPDKIYAIESNLPLTDFTPSSVQAGAVIRDSRYKARFSYNKYDVSNILETQKTDDITKSYLWGYQKLYPVAEVTGADHTTISGLVDQLILDNPSSDLALRNELNKLRNGLAPTKAQVTTYTYKPLVGITSQTDPNGKIIYYEYDAFNRLILIRDKDNNIIKKICYNYAGQPENCSLLTFSSVSKSGIFTRNNCGAGTGSSVTYTVAAGAYTSVISQADADQQAQNDVNNNGQAYANTNGVCTVSCSFSMSPGYYSTYATISSAGNIVSFNLVFYATSAMNIGTEYMIGTISSGCRPPTNKPVTLFNGGRTFYVTFYASTGLVGVRPIFGTDVPSYTSINLAGSYDKTY